MSRQRFINLSCPNLPEINSALPITHTREFRSDCGVPYFESCLELAQSLWRSGYPAQAILQLDKSMMATSEVSLLNYPYDAILWIIENSPSDQFLGNPVRHFQHLASRMNMKQPNAAVRTWRAWACLLITEMRISKATDIYPRDSHQLEKEGLSIPDLEETLTKLETLGSRQEVESIILLMKS